MNDPDKRMLGEGGKSAEIAGDSCESTRTSVETWGFGRAKKRNRSGEKVALTRGKNKTLTKVSWPDQSLGETCGGAKRERTKPVAEMRRFCRRFAAEKKRLGKSAELKEVWVWGLDG